MTVKIEFKRRNLIIAIGIILLIVGVLCFYGASRINWDYVTTYNDNMNSQIIHPVGNLSIVQVYWSGNFSQFGYPEWGFSYEYYVRGVGMQPNDVITVNLNTPLGFNKTIYMVFVTEHLSILASAQRFGTLTYQSSGWLYGYVCLVSPTSLVPKDVQNMIVTTQLNHYETPHWFLFGLGVVAVSCAFALEVISTRPNKEKPKLGV
jgi:hypothetical protein